MQKFRQFIFTTALATSPLGAAASADSLNDRTLQFLFESAARIQQESSTKAAAFKTTLDTGPSAPESFTAAFGLGAYYLGKHECKAASQYLAMAEAIGSQSNELMPFVGLHKALAAYDCGDFAAAATSARQLEPHSKIFGNNIDVLRIQLILSSYEQLQNRAAIIAYYQRTKNKLIYSSLAAANEAETIVAKAMLAEGADIDAVFEILERVAAKYPTNEISRWAFAQLKTYSEQSTQTNTPSYHYSLSLLRSLARNITLEAELSRWITSKLDGRVRIDDKIKTLNIAEKIDFFLSARMYNDAAVYADKALSENLYHKHERPKILLQAARAATEIGQDQRAIDLYQTYLLEFSPDFVPPKIREMLGFAHNRLGEFKTAALHFKAVANRSESINNKWHHFWNLYRAEEWQAALDLLNDGSYVSAQDTNEPNAIYYWRAKVLEKLDLPNQAKQDYLSLLRQDGTSFYSVLVQNRFPDLKDSDDSEDEPVLTASLANVPSPRRLNPPRQRNRQIRPNDEYPILYDEILTPLSKQIDIDKYLVLAIMRSESAYNAYATSPVGAKGLLQLMPYTAIKIADRIGHEKFSVSELESPETNIIFGAFYLRLLLEQFENPMLAVAAYNAGPIAVNKWLHRCQGCSIDEFVESIPYRETRRYVKTVFRHFAEYNRKHNSNETLPVSWDMPRPVSDTEHLF